MTADITELRRLLAAATPGPWTAEPCCPDHAGTIEAGYDWRVNGPSPRIRVNAEDAALIAAARNALPGLLAAAERLAAVEARCARLEAVLRGLVDELSVPTLDDARLDYIEVQVDRTALAEARAALKEDTDD